jgi:hypothetical protein
MKFAAHSRRAWQRKRGNPSWRTFCTTTRIAAMASRLVPGRARRTRNQGRRSRTVRFALTDAEYGELSDAARRAGLARGAYAAEAALSVARGVTVTPDAPLRDAFYALDRAALLVRKIGVNLNQAVAKLNKTGQRSGDLLPYARESERRAARLEAAGEDLRKLARSAIRVRGRRTAGPPAAGPQSAGRG